MRNIFLLICLQKYRPVEYLLLFKQHSSGLSKCRMCHNTVCWKKHLRLLFFFFYPHTYIYPIKVWVFFSSELEVDIEEGHKVLPLCPSKLTLA